MGFLFNLGYMNNYTFFDKRYWSPINFTGEILFETKIQNKELKIFRTNEEENPYLIVFFGDNTEIYPENNLSNILNYLKNDINSTKSFVDKYIIEKYSSTEQNLNAFHEEKYNLYLIEINNEQFLLYETDKIEILRPNDELNPQNITIPDWGLNNLTKIKYNPLVTMLRSPLITSRIKHPDNIKKFLNSSDDGDQEIDTCVSSINENKKLYIYAEKVEKLKNNKDGFISLIHTKEHFYLIINDKIYKDVWLSRILLLLPLDLYFQYLHYLNLDKKYHILMDGPEKKFKEIFKNKKYKQIKIPLTLTSCSGNIGYSERGVTTSQFINFNQNKLEHKSHFNGWYTPHSSIFNKKDHESYIYFESNIHVERYPIYTNGEILLQRTSNTKTYYLIKTQNQDNSAEYIVIIENDDSNEFYTFYHSRILYFLVSENLIPFSLEEITKHIGIFTKLDDLGKIRPL